MGSAVSIRAQFLFTCAIVEQLREPRISASVSSRSSHQVAEAGLHDTHPSLDIRPILQGLT